MKAYIGIKYYKDYRNKVTIEGLSTILERKGYDTICLAVELNDIDTFNWQGKDFYLSLGYEEVGSYENETDNFSEHFFLKRL